MARHVEDKVIIITGAAGGFGRLVAQKTAALGARVVASDVNRKDLDATVASIVEAGGEAEGCLADAGVYGATKAAVRFLSEALRQESQGRIKVTTIRPTGVPATGLGAGIINPAAIGGVLGAGYGAFLEKMGAMFSENPPAELTDPEGIEYFALSADLLADQIVFVIDQPWGVSISDLTVRASGDSYLL